jgi:hypothetical protein
LTGFIPVSIGDVIRFKNVAFMDMTGANGSISRAKFIFYDINFGLVVESADYSPTSLMAEPWNAVYGDDGNLIQCTVPTVYKNTIAYMRIIADDFNANSIITVNQRIDPLPETAYTNVLALATDGDGNIYNGVGYKNNTRLSVSSQPPTEKDETGWDLSGYIEAGVGDVIRLKNVLFYEPTPTVTYARCGIIAFDSSYGYISQMVGFTITDNPLGSPMENVVHDENGQLAQFTIPDNVARGVAFIRICAHDFTDDSVITVNEPIE